MSGFTNHVFHFFLSLGIWGPFTLGGIDALLFAPFANDVLLVSLISLDRAHAWIYPLMAAAGSTLGCVVLDAISRKGGEKGLEKLVDRRQLSRVKDSVSSRAGVAVALAASMPPPFPFTAVIGTASALQYPRRKLLSIIAVVRLARFALLAWLAVRYGRHILRWSEMPAVRWTVIGLIVISVGGSAWAIWHRLKR